jgi:hypothetical protein
VRARHRSGRPVTLNAIICAYRTGDVIGLALRQLVDSPVVSRVLVVDGPHKGFNFGHYQDRPSVKQVCDIVKSDKIHYRNYENCRTLADKNNAILRDVGVSDDCDWLLSVDSDEIYHEDALLRLAKFLRTAKYGRYRMLTVNPYPDFFHHFVIPKDWKPRLYEWFPGAACPGFDDGHQYVIHGQQRRKKGGGQFEMEHVPPAVCEIYHLNALRPHSKRVTPKPNNRVHWTGGDIRGVYDIVPLERERVPRVIRNLKRATLQE